MNTASKNQLKLGHEYLLPNEDFIIQKMVDELQDEMRRDYIDEGKFMPRQVHTKMHGCVKGKFIVEPNLAPELRVGVFDPELRAEEFKDKERKPNEYNCWIRFSNSKLPPQSDKKKDIRGIAIKLLGVPGEKILNHKRNEKTQDFLLMTSETFFSKNIREFEPLLHAAIMEKSFKKILLMISFALRHLKLVGRLKKSMVKCDNALDMPYWSTQPFRFGKSDQAVKYFLKPSDNNVIINENTEEDDYLRINMGQTLNSHMAEFDFFVQFQEDPYDEPIEDPTVPWKAPFHKVATLRIPAQRFDSNKQIRFGEDLSFNAWHALPEHRPLGNFNRARKRVYTAMSKFRHEYNDRPDIEPEDTDDFLEGTSEPEEKTIPYEIPIKKVIHMQADVTVECSKEVAFDFISSGAELPNWLKAVGKIPAALIGKNITDTYNKPGDRRIVEFDHGESVQEEMFAYDRPASYAYRVSKFSSSLRKFSDEAYSVIWFDTIDDKTRITWEYMYTAKNFIARFLLKYILRFIKYEEFMEQSLANAKDYIENGD